MSRPDVKEQRIPQIIDAAASVFARRGIDGANMEEIAKAAGVSKGTIYHYFASKEEVIEALVRRVFSLDRSAVIQLRIGSGTTRERLLGYADALAAVVQQDRVLFLVAAEIQGRAARIPRLKVLASGFYQEYLEVLKAVLAQGITDGQVNARIDVAAAALGYVATIEGSLILSSHLDIDLRESMLTSVSTYLDGFVSA